MSPAMTAADLKAVRIMMFPLTCAVVLRWMPAGVLAAQTS
jgi:hypothetical protein